MNLHEGWVPHDEGTLGQSAERVLHGETPHRDFDDPYAGGLAYIDAAIFKFFGINLFSLRLFSSFASPPGFLPSTLSLENSCRCGPPLESHSSPSHGAFRITPLLCPLGLTFSLLPSEPWRWQDTSASR
jgi:hypothetical protein